MLCWNLVSQYQLSIHKKTKTIWNKIRLELNRGVFLFWVNRWNKDILTFMSDPTMIHNYSDVIMGAIASQITSLMTVYSTVYSDADQRKHQSTASLAFVRGIHQWPVNSPHKRPVTRKMLPFDDVIMYICYAFYTPGWCGDQNTECQFLSGIGYEHKMFKQESVENTSMYKGVQWYLVILKYYLRRENKANEIKVLFYQIIKSNIRMCIGKRKN